MINLVTASLGCGKTLYVVNELRKIHLDNLTNAKSLNKRCSEIYNKDKPEEDHLTFFTREEMITILGEDEIKDKIRPIYANIDGLLIPHQPSPEDWRECPKGSVIVYDECHKFKLFKRDRSMVSNDPIMIDMNESRHLGMDFWFITQSPKYLSNHLSGIVGTHYHLHRAMNASAATIFMWRYFCSSPNSSSSKNLCESQSIFSYPKSLYKFYKSADSHTHKFKLPKKFIYMASALLCMIALIVYLLNKPSTVGNLTGESFTALNTKDKNKATTSSDPKTLTDKVSDTVNPVDQKTTSEPPKNSIEYNPTNPYSTEDWSQYKDRSYNTAPLLAGCLKSAKTCDCYTQQGTKIKDMPKKECHKIIEGGLPFNPFSSGSQGSSYQANSSNNQDSFNSAPSNAKDAREPQLSDYNRI